MIHDKASDVLVAFREEAGYWQAHEYRPGESVVERNRLLVDVLAGTEVPDKESFQRHYVKTEHATDYIMLISLTVALKKTGLIE